MAQGDTVLHRFVRQLRSVGGYQNALLYISLSPSVEPGKNSRPCVPWVETGCRLELRQFPVSMRRTRSGCSALAANGHAVATAPPKRLMNSRLCKCLKRASLVQCLKTSTLRPGGELEMARPASIVNRPNVRDGSVKRQNTRCEQMFSASPLTTDMR
jgi:hypothetical protein